MQISDSMVIGTRRAHFLRGYAWKTPAGCPWDSRCGSQPGVPAIPCSLQHKLKSGKKTSTKTSFWVQTPSDRHWVGVFHVKGQGSRVWCTSKPRQGGLLWASWETARISQNSFSSAPNRDLRQCEPSQNSSLYWLAVQEIGVAILTAIWKEVSVTNHPIWICDLEPPKTAMLWKCLRFGLCNLKSLAIRDVEHFDPRNSGRPECLRTEKFMFKVLGPRKRHLKIGFCCDLSQEDQSRCSSWGNSWRKALSGPCPGKCRLDLSGFKV